MSNTEKDERLHIRLRSKDKRKIKSLAKLCHLSVSEYVVKRALGFIPVYISHDALYTIDDTLTKILNSKVITPKIEDAALRVNLFFPARFIVDIAAQN